MCLFHAQLITLWLLQNCTVQLFLFCAAQYVTKVREDFFFLNPLLSTFSNCADKLFTSTLTGAAGVLAVLLLLLGFLLYKYKQVGCSPHGSAVYFETPELVSL